MVVKKADSNYNHDESDSSKDNISTSSWDVIASGGNHSTDGDSLSNDRGVKEASALDDPTTGADNDVSKKDLTSFGDGGDKNNQVPNSDKNCKMDGIAESSNDELLSKARKMKADSNPKKPSYLQYEDGNDSINRNDNLSKVDNIHNSNSGYKSSINESKNDAQFKDSNQNDEYRKIMSCSRKRTTIRKILRFFNHESLYGVSTEEKIDYLRQKKDITEIHIQKALLLFDQRMNFVHVDRNTGMNNREARSITETRHITHKVYCFSLEEEQSLHENEDHTNDEHEALGARFSSSCNTSLIFATIGGFVLGLVTAASVRWWFNGDFFFLFPPNHKEQKQKRRPEQQAQHSKSKDMQQNHLITLYFYNNLRNTTYVEIS